MQALAQCHLETKTVVAVLFKNLSGRPFLGKVVDLDLLLCAGFNLTHANLLRYPETSE